MNRPMKKNDGIIAHISNFSKISSNFLFQINWRVPITFASKIFFPWVYSCRNKQINMYFYTIHFFSIFLKYTSQRKKIVPLNAVLFERRFVKKP